ncbi:MAG: TIGR01777 family oxidoreductase [Sporomusaceae bacterium]|nr:TIGR01777 family oxidoreductase [Sporomusaceae bacterium]
MNILLTGGTGFIGTALTKQLLHKGHAVTHLLKQEPANAYNIPYIVSKNPQELLPADTLARFEAIINLAGYNIGKDLRWTKAIKDKIRDSRLSRTAQIANSISYNFSTGQKTPSLLINASAVGYYGTAPLGPLTEHSPSGTGFLAKTCRDWEATAEKARNAKVKIVRLRFGVVLGPNGGILTRLAQPFAYGLGGIIGNGQNHVSWIHLHDLIALIEFSLSGKLDGPYNATAPRPVTMQEFGETLGEALNKHCWTQFPAWLARCCFGEMADEVLLCSQQAVPSAALAQGFTFKYPTLDKALQQIYLAKQ